ncbi:MAG: transcriptional regulator MalT [candidate division BRC1 bacterium ADurb.BinA364]|nr:MAG: transcriptional regulator MalT [candidate division BRC1 bacterium ADurb.BinA364]
MQIQLNLGVLSVRMGLCARGVERLRQAQAEAEQLEFERGVQLALTAQIDAALKMGDFRGAARLSRRLFRRFGDARFADVRAVALTNRARAYLADGETDRAAADIQQAMRLLDGGENYIGLIDALFVRSEIELARNEPRQALESARSAIREIQSSREPEFMAAARILLARCQMALGEIEEARKTLASALKAARQANLPREEGWALLAQGQIAIAREERPKAQKLLREALALAERSEDEALRAAALDALDSVS